ncbi:hypothetical protein ACOSQ2_014342 [Xanthoceras sorbifolium]
MVHINTHIVNEVKRHDNYFIQQRDRLGRLGLSSLQKITTVFRMLAYGVPADSTDKYIKIRESTAIESMKRFCRAVMEVFREHYLRSPNAVDVTRLLQIGEKRGFPGMLWRRYSGRSGSPTIILEALMVYTLNGLLLNKKHAGRMLNVQLEFSRFWNKHVLHDIMSVYIIMHIMIVQDERNVHADIDNWREAPAFEVEMAVDENTRFQQFLA